MKETGIEPRMEVVILYEYFYPGFKAGGPIQSLINLIIELESDYQFKVITTAYDLNDATPYPGVILDSWNEISFHGLQNPIQVFYSSGFSNYRKIFRALFSIRAQIVYCNGMFGRWGFILLLLKKIGLLRGAKLIVSPRGMLQAGALSIKKKKKKIFLALFKLIALQKDMRWHATDEQEKQDIKREFGNKEDIIVATNIPKPITSARNNQLKTTGQLKLVFLSLLTEKKNLHVLLEAFAIVNAPICLHIYGPIKDENYWLKCQRLMEGQVHEIVYKGSIMPKQVQATFTEYHALVLPTKGENFGHAIYESLSVGTPVIVSSFTPWGRLQDCQAGITVDTFNPEDWAEAIRAFVKLNQEEYSAYSKGAYNLAKDYVFKNDFKAQYKNLFS